jgi:hypothetical protein
VAETPRFDEPRRPRACRCGSGAGAGESEGAAAKAAIEQVDLVVERVSHPDDPLGQGIQLLSPYLPAPVQRAARARRGPGRVGPAGRAASY